LNSEVVFSTRNYLTILNSMNFRGQNSSYKNLKKKSHQACTVWKRFELCLLQCVKTCDFLFILQSSFSNQPTISHSQYFIGKNHISTASSSSSCSSLESFFFCDCIHESLPSFFQPPNHSQTLIIILSRLKRFLLRECQIHASAFSIEDHRKFFLGKKALETRDIPRNALVLVSAIYFPHWISVSLYLCWFHSR